MRKVSTSIVAHFHNIWGYARICLPELHLTLLNMDVEIKRWKHVFFSSFLLLTVMSSRFLYVKF